tara:strand:- start:483 stop:1244 length:762 start_codon:yes stop_codon:yes gene_type:complete
MAETKFPTEMVNLPSKGWFYDSTNPLASGEVEVKYMTAKEEDILTSQNLIKKGIVFDKLLDALVVSKIKLDDMLIGDKNAVLIAARVLAYGKNYEFDYIDPLTGEKGKGKFDLTKLEDKKIKFDKDDKGKNEFDFQLPASKRVLTFKLLTSGDEKAIDRELKSMKKLNKLTGINPEITTRMKGAIVAVDGDREIQTVRKFVDNEFLSIDALKFRAHLAVMTPDVNMVYSQTISDGSEEEMTVPMTVQFFWPAS